MYPVTLGDLLMNVIELEASDLHIVVGCPPIMRRFGELQNLNDRMVGAEDGRELISSIMSPEQLQLLNRNRQIDFACSILGVARFRVHVSFERDNLNAEFRAIPYVPPRLEDLDLPAVVAEVIDLPRGLVLVTGPTGAGKSTTLAAMVDRINRRRSVRVVTIEEPIEFLHTSQKAIITQREIGRDTLSYHDAIRATLRQDPDVILIGEMRDPETIITALTAAETGHLVLSTLHTQNTVQALERIMDALPEGNRKQFTVQLSTSLRAIVSQRLLARLDGAGRVPAIEVLIATPTIRSLILEGKFGDMYHYMVNGRFDGMQTFTQSLLDLYQSGLVTEKEAYSKADKPTEFRLAIEGHVTTGADLQELSNW